ncbi:MAG: aliphatic sulfonate ABC transporter substrate-binding protein [Candidatus Omnitrophica bacterium]|nr:aliphatic sulfonate ABC transporter substrate-binding protein [Candidatus Omnitrophota bacterium]
MRKKVLLGAVTAAGVALFFLSQFFSCSKETAKLKVRVGHLPNLTHAQALVGRANGVFESRLAPDAEIEWKTFNAGPSVIEAIFAGQVDMAYVGPSPAVNGYVRSGGEALRAVAGAASGGAALVVRKDAGIVSPSDFRGKKIATPQFGNTQDVSLRSWLARHGLKTKEKGGDVQVLPLANADQLTLFARKDIDASWTVEPWVSLFLGRGDVKVFLEESELWPGGKYAATLLVARKKFLEEHAPLVRKFIEVHAELTDWIRRHPEEAKQALNEELEREIHQAVPKEVLDGAWGRVEFTTEPLQASIETQARAAYEAGFLKEEPNLAGFFDLRLLEEALQLRKGGVVLETTSGK